jgi:aspartyl-tRNA(Asn)/glutamyl-tRNA(Gln) amidotransferase subunit A
MAHTAADCAVVLRTIAGHDPLDGASSAEPVPDYSAAIGKDIRGIRVGVVSHFWTEDLPAAPEMRDGMVVAIEILEQLGANVRDVRLKPISEFNEAKLNIQRPELFLTYGNDIRSRRQQFGLKLRHRMDSYEQISAVDYLAAKRRQGELTADMLRAMADFDVLVTAGPGPASRIEDVAARPNHNVADLTLPFNLTGFPAITTCIGFTKNDLPFSMQIIGKPFDESAVLRVADAYERATPWHLRRPVIHTRTDETAFV